MTTLDRPPAQIAPPSAARPGSVPLAGPNRMLLHGVSWETYERLRAETDAAGQHVRMTFDGGYLELQMPSRIHEIIISLVRAILEQYCMERGVEFMPTGATTWKRRLLE